MTDLIALSGIQPALKVTGKKQALQELARLAERETGMEARTVFDLLLKRERLGTTGIGQGIAIPHCRLPGLERMVGLFARLERPVEFDSIDGQPVDLIFALLAPENAGAEHLRALSRVTRLLRDAGVCARLRGATTADAIYIVLTETEGSAAA